MEEWGGGGRISLSKLRNDHVEWRVEFKKNSFVAVEILHQQYEHVDIIGLS